MARDANVAARLGKYGYGKNKTVMFSECVIPEEFQRKLGKRGWDTFTKALFGRVIIMEVDGAKVVVDGQHRIAHAQSHDMESGPGIVYENGTMEDAAALFDLFNSERVKLGPSDAFRAACVSGDQGMVELDSELLARGLDGWDKGRTDQYLSSIGSVVKLYHDLGLDHTLYTLDVIEECWPWDVAKSPHVRCIRGFGQFFRPVKKFTVVVRGSQKSRTRRWNPNDRAMLAGFIAANYPGDIGLESFLSRAQAKSPGGGGGGGSLGMERLLDETLRKAKNAARVAA